MPELPEVETTRRGIATVMTGQPLKALNIFEPRMRWPVPADLPDRVNGQMIRSCERRGKYLLIGFDHGVMIVLLRHVFLLHLSFRWGCVRLSVADDSSKPFSTESSPSLGVDDCPRVCGHFFQSLK